MPQGLSEDKLLEGILIKGTDHDYDTNWRIRAALNVGLKAQVNQQPVAEPRKHEGEVKP